MPLHAQPRIRILIVDDHPIVRHGYQQLIGNHADLEVCGCAESEAEAVDQAKTTNPHLAIVDITLKDSNGIELIRSLRSYKQGPKILVISAHDENVYAERVLDAGALGYINKQEATEQLIDGVRTVLAGEVYVSQQITRRLLKRRVDGRQNRGDKQSVDRLTNRELQVFDLIGHGQSTKDIAATMKLSPKTIERYKENIKHKLGFHNATELVQQATRWGMEKK